jgi:lysozyme
MEYIKTFEAYNEELIVEKLNLQPLLDKLKKSVNKKTVAKLIVGSLLTVLTVSQAVNFINSRQDLDKVEKVALIDTISKYKDPLTLQLSEIGLEHIKNHEKLRLKAYKIGDGKITIGYGHAKPIRKSKYRVGQRITVEIANKLLREDVAVATDGIKRMFKQWNEKGIYVKVTQNQFDAMVSMAFNMGVSAFRQSAFVRKLKQNDLESAAELIKTTNLNDNFPGLEDRRMIEYAMFVS